MTIGSIVLFFTFVLFNSPLWGQEEAPYWRGRPTLYKKVIEDRKVLVAVKSKTQEKMKTVKMQGVGVVNVPLTFAQKEIMAFEKLPQISPHFDKVVHQPEEKKIDLLVSALGYQTRLILKYSWQEKDKQKQMDWVAVEGPFKGMVGHFQLLPITTRKTEIVLWSSFESTHIPIPAFLLNFTLEVICEKVAQKMRSFMEESYKKSFVSGV